MNEKKTWRLRSDESWLDHKGFLCLLVGLILVVYFWNIGGNDIWTANEGFYADAVRHMRETGDILDIRYNGEPRLNKPPMTYWLAALSTAVFGMNEFALRLPVVLTGLGSIFLTFLIGRKLHDRRTGWVAALAMAVSFQFVGNSRYVSPEVPLTFFFTLSLYLFLIGHLDRRRSPILLSYVALALTVLTKGLPFVLVIGGIMIVYLLIAAGFDWKVWIRRLVWSWFLPGMLFVLAVGGLWYVHNYLTYGDAFADVQYHEIIHQALFRKSDALEGLFFYLQVISWGFLPYSPVFFYALIRVLRSREFVRQHAFSLSWVVVMWTLLTLAKGKIPTYFIQAHVPMSVMAGYAAIQMIPASRRKQILHATLFTAPALIGWIASVLLVALFRLPLWSYAVCAAPVVLMILRRDVVVQPFIAVAATLFVFGLGVLPIIETYRPYDAIGRVISENVPDRSVPLLVENLDLHNMPYYAQRRMLPCLSFEAIRDYARTNDTLALVRAEKVKDASDSVILWKGRLYEGSSESRLGILIMNIIFDRYTFHDAEGKRRKATFADYRLIYQRARDHGSL